MLCRNGAYAKTADVTLRHFEEWGHTFAYAPQRRAVLSLNATASFIVELCDGRPFQQIEAEYVRVLAPRVGERQAKHDFHAGFTDLLRRNIISVIADADV